MIGTLDLTTIAQASAERIAYCLLGGMVITAFAALLLQVVRRANAGTRFAVWFSALLAIAAVPLSVGISWRHGNALAGTAPSQAAITLPQSWALIVFGVWVAIAALALLRVGAGLWQLFRLRRSCVPVDVSRLDPLLRETLGQSRRGRPVALCISDRVHAPVAIGFAKPAVVIPGDLMHDLSAAELQQVLLHEIAHLQRWDDWTNLAQKIVKAFLFFHPAVWWIERRMSLEREMACDDAVLKETEQPHAYAQCLARLAEKNFMRRRAALAQAAVSRLRQTTLRVARILDGNRPAATTRVWRPAVVLVAGFAATCAVCVVQGPRLVAFKSDAPSSLPELASTAIARPIPVVNAAYFPPAKRTPVPAEVRQPEALNLPAAVKLPLSNNGRAALAPETMKRSASLRINAAGQARFVASETFLMFVEGRQDGEPTPVVYQVRVWRITLLRFANNPTEKEGGHKAI